MFVNKFGVASYLWENEWTPKVKKKNFCGNEKSCMSFLVAKLNKKVGKKECCSRKKVGCCKI